MSWPESCSDLTDEYSDTEEFSAYHVFDFFHQALEIISMKIYSIILLLMSAILLSACGGSSSDSGSSNPESTIIVGSWSFIYPAVQCTETYTFYSDNTFKWTSLDEVASGTYSFSSQANLSNRHALSFEVTRDNQQFDCQGNNHNDVGLVVDIFAEFPSETVMNWYYESTGGSLIVTLDKN